MSLALRCVRPLVRMATRHLSPEARNSLSISLLLDGPDRPPRTVQAFDEPRIMVLAPHADDEVIGCGGAIALHARHGGQVRVVVVTDGAQGSRRLTDPVLTDRARASLRAELIARRRDEAIRAGQTLGVSDVAFLDGPDGELRPTRALLQRLHDELDQWRPQLVYLPFVMDQHGDHWQTNRLLAATLPRCGNWQSALQIRGYEVWAPLLANRLIDITDVVDRKRAALLAYDSQLADRDYLNAVAGLNHYRALHLPDSQDRVAEAFHQTSARGYLSLMRAIEERRQR